MQVACSVAVDNADVPMIFTAGVDVGGTSAGADLDLTTCIHFCGYLIFPYCSVTDKWEMTVLINKTVTLGVLVSTLGHHSRCLIVEMFKHFLNECIL